MTPAWKIRRELLRLWRQLTFLPMHPIEQAWFRLHAALYPGAYRSHAGDQPRTDDVAIFLIYQPDRLQDTVLTTCAHLASAGYTVHLVSNAPLRPEEIARLRPLCGRIIERPNHGYDFGGYRQAILDCLGSGAPVARLLILNDSIWFPALKDCDLLHRLHALGADLAGAVYYDHRSPRRAHLQSYLIAFSAHAVASAAFRSFWRNYAMSNNKVRTIRNGEMRLTRVCRESGLSVASLHRAYEVPNLGALPDCARACVAAYDRDRMVLASRTAARGGERGGYILSNHPLVNLGVLRLPILKKDHSAPYRQQRLALLSPDSADVRDQLEPGVRAAVERWDGP